MDKNLTERILWIAAALSLLLGVIVCVKSMIAIRGHSKQLALYSLHMKKLGVLKQRAERCKSAKRVFDELSIPHPRPLKDLLSETLPGVKYSSREPPSRPTVAGWSVRRSEVSFPDIELTKLAAFLSKAESQRPPWRMTMCTIRSIGTDGGRAHVTLTLEALDKES